MSKKKNYRKMRRWDWDDNPNASYLRRQSPVMRTYTWERKFINNIERAKKLYDKLPNLKLKRQFIQLLSKLADRNYKNFLEIIRSEEDYWISRIGEEEYYLFFGD